MAKDKMNIPQIRFKGFEGEWERNVLKKIAKINPTSNLPDKFKYIDLESVKGSSLIDYRIEYKNKAPSRAQRVAEKGDIFYQTVRPYQKNNYLFEIFEKNYVFSTGYAQIRPLKNITSRFLFSLIQSEKFVNKVLVRCTGTSYPAINSTELSLIDVRYPLLKEQTQIGDFFQKIDQVIELQQKALDTARAYKQSMLQKMFPQKGEKVPRVRFAGFSGKWVIGNLGEYAQIGTGARDVQEATDNGAYPFFIRSEEVKRINSYSFDGEAILIPGEGRLGEIFHYINGKFDYHQRVYKISEFKGLHGKFVLHYMRVHFKRHALKYTVKTTVDSLRLPMIKEFPIYYPSLEEQTKIGNFFQKLDQQIEQQAQKLATYQQLKKAMLQRMFV